MRRLTDKEIDTLYGGHCPFCSSAEFYEGPSGGICTNIFCADERCEAGFNLHGLKELGVELIQEPKGQHGEA